MITTNSIKDNAWISETNLVPMLGNPLNMTYLCYDYLRI